MKNIFTAKSILPIILFLGFFFFFFLDLDSLISWDNIRENYSKLNHKSSEDIIYSIIIFFLVYLLATAFSLPVLSVLSLLSGALYGWMATLLVITSGTLGCWIVFIAAKGFLYEYLSQKTNSYISSIITNFNKGPFTWLLALKLFPFLPVSFSNIVPGVLGMRSSIFLLATFLAFIPGTLIYVGFGRGIAKLISSHQTISLSMFDNPDLYIPLIGLLLISMTSFVVKFLRIKKGN
ncbi:MAG: VTT domain-containing protein [Gammaproteobacteria bacterium]|jgi:uncharacterized membrane protein YdjX (TVP38/TMEM64 family)|nr:VTT domain-containing protein [Gammaproteobacteria bacterium]